MKQTHNFVPNKLVAVSTEVSHSQNAWDYLKEGSIISYYKAETWTWTK